MARIPLDIACKVASVTPATIRQWVHRGCINRYTDGYEIAEILLWIDQERSQWAMDMRAGLPIKSDDTDGKMSA